MFINELTPPQDISKYRFAEIDKNFVIGGTSSRQWTIDRDRNIYLRNVARGAGSEMEVRNRLKWTFYWKGYELTLRLDLLDGSGERGEPGWSHWRLVFVNGRDGLPEPLMAHRREVLADLKDALIAYKDGGVYSSNTDYSVTLDLDSECEL